MAQIFESMNKMHTKIDKMATRLLFVERKLKELTRVRTGKVLEIESEEEEEKEGEEEEEEEKDNQKKEKGEEEDSSEIESEGSPLVPRKTGHKYALRIREMRSKFKNTMEMALELSPSPTPSPSTPPRATPPISPH